MGRHAKPRCLENEPDCFNCKFPECIATMSDINRQEAIKNYKLEELERKKRDEEVVRLYNQGLSYIEIGKRVGHSSQYVGEIIRKHKVSLQ